MITCGCVLFIMARPAQATQRPPVKLTMPADSPMAAAGQVYHGAWELYVGKAGVIDDFALEGKGWNIQSLDESLEGKLLDVGVYRVPFTAVPAHPNAPLRFMLTYEGRGAWRELSVGPEVFADRGKPGASAVIVPGAKAAGPRREAGAATLRFTGRIVYLRPSGFDQDGDPILVNGTYEGVDGILVEVMDEDDISDETIWSGYTNAAGYFDTGDISWDDCDGTGCDDPDIYLRYECNTPIVDVEKPEIGDPTYSWANDGNVIDDFTGSFHDFGTHTPLDITQMPALHIHNSIVRAHRFVLTRSGTGLNTPQVDVIWPDGDNASHVGILDELYISHRREWEEPTHTHEFGHHFMDEFMDPPTSDYCNDLCDPDPDATIPDCGHCKWCRETDHDAFNEGWPNWLGHVVTSDYQNLYVFSDGKPYQPLSPESDENLDSCDKFDPAERHDPFITEGFVGALLHDIYDPNVDANGNPFFEEHDNDGDGELDLDGITDCLDLGVEEIFDVVVNDQPTTMIAFMTAFQNRYPHYRSRLWSTAFNVHPAYVGGGIFPTDTQPPGKVEVVTSPSHPIGVGGSSTCITVFVEAPPDDVTGACAYSYEWSYIPSGVEPDMVEEPDAIGSCTSFTSPARSFGDHYLSIRAKDCADHWSNEWETFGPFTVTECNANGILDICEVAGFYNGENCNAAWYGDVGLLPCRPSDAFCETLFPGSCGMGSDCQPNAVPDECDIENGTSQDCNEDGVPDECQDMVNWIAGSGSWHDPQNWDIGQVPQSGQNVCINAPGDITVSYT
ncbi:MAG: hypothetical protein AMXMBFR13_03110, partial [Phycisphaerae bacterium]